MPLVKESVDMSKIVIKHCKAPFMKAYGYSKPVGGMAFQLFFYYMLGWHKSTSWH